LRDGSSARGNHWFAAEVSSLPTSDTEGIPKSIDAPAPTITRTFLFVTSAIPPHFVVVQLSFKFDRNDWFWLLRTRQSHRPPSCVMAIWHSAAELPANLAQQPSALTATDPLSLMKADPSDARFVG
jgi:hypothetical protein